MKSRARWIWVAAMVAVPGVASAAQQRPPRGLAGPAGVDRAAARALRLGEEIGLTETQRDELRDLRADALGEMETWERELLEARQELRARRREVGADPATTRAEREALREEARSRMEALAERRRERTAPLQARYETILGPEQRLELRDGLRRDRRRAGPRGARPDRGRRGERRFRRPGAGPGRWSPEGGRSGAETGGPGASRG
jgi:Spy/CpxP family protein refolding chaperone